MAWGISIDIDYFTMTVLMDPDITWYRSASLSPSTRAGRTQHSRGNREKKQFGFHSPPPFFDFIRSLELVTYSTGHAGAQLKCQRESDKTCSSRLDRRVIKVYFVILELSVKEIGRTDSQEAITLR
jgi:hypothetical protein